MSTRRPSTPRVALTDHGEDPTAARDLIRLAERLTEVVGVPADVVDSERVFDHAKRTGIGTSILSDTIGLDAALDDDGLAPGGNDDDDSEAIPGYAPIRR